MPRETRREHIGNAFNAYVDHYDVWYETPKGRALLATEAAALRPLLARFPHPYLEVGTGTGRFAEALGIEYGLDPSHRAARMARVRGVKAVCAAGETLPFRDGCFGGVLIAFTLCFVDDPRQVLLEARRVLIPEGGMVLGFLPGGTPWADYYTQRGAVGHPIYARARFHTLEQVETLLSTAGFRPLAYQSTLFQQPGQETYQVEQPVADRVLSASFLSVAAGRA